MKRKVLPFSVRNRILFLIDMLIIIAAHFLVLMLVADYNELPYRFMLILRLVGAACITFAVVLNVGRNYKIFWAYAGAKDYLRMALSLALASFITLTVDYLIRRNDWYLAVRYRFILCFAAMFVSSAGILMVRMLIRGLNRLNKENHSVASTMVRTLIVGAGEGATMLIKEIKNNEKLENNIIGLVDDDFQKRNLIIRGARVLGTVQDIPKLAEKHDIEEIIIAIPSLEAERNKQILAISPIWRGDDGVNRERFNWCIDIVKRETKKYPNITSVDGHTLVPNVEECFCDKLHPNEYGCILLAQNLYKIIKKIKF